MQKHNLNIFADYFQFYIQDDDTRYGDLSNSWTVDAVEKLLAVGSHVLGIGTVRNMDVNVEITLLSKSPKLEVGEWDRVNRSSILCETGRLVIAGCTDYYPDAKRIDIKPGIYDVVVGYRNLEELSEDKLDGDDSYHIFISPQVRPHV